MADSNNGSSNDSRYGPGTVCVGRYDFPGRASHDLPFRKGDTLIIIKVSKDPHWYKARRTDGVEGMIPYNYVTEQKSLSRNHRDSPDIPMMAVMAPTRDHSSVIEQRGVVKLHTMPWFHGDIDRTESVRLLSPIKDGLFLVRESQTNKGSYTLCVCCDHQVQHYQIQRNDRDWVTADGEEYFENLVKLVEHYQQDADGLCCKLKNSVEKSGAHDVVVSLEDFKSKGWGIPHCELTKISKIGKGEFGEVWLGEYKSSKVAIKMLKEIETKQDTQKFLAEASVMTTLQCKNLVSLIGVSVDESPICLVTEYMGKGSLEEYLRTRGRSIIPKKSLHDFSKDVCNGMMYLESRSFIHRDLAARNVLLSDELQAKVSDFGLARQGVTRTDSQKLPVKWTAPEALRDKAMFSNKSDVWSFGVLLWEIYSYGRVPYPKISANDIVQHVEKGYRMDAPDGCPPNVYSIMRECWAADPNQRPNFTRVMKSLDSMPPPS